MTITDTYNANVNARRTTAVDLDRHVRTLIQLAQRLVTENDEVIDDPRLGRLSEHLATADELTAAIVRDLGGES